MSHWLAPDAQFERARRTQRAFAIHAYVGKNGSGKSLWAVAATLPTLEEGRPVLSTVRLLDYDNPRPCDGWDYGNQNIYGGDLTPCPIVDPITGLHTPDHNQSHPLYLRFTNWQQLLDFERGDVLMDEITGVADSADHAGLPVEVRNKLPQLRRADIAVRITGLSWSRLNKRLREACMAVTRVRGLLPVPASSDFGRDRIFRPKRMSVAGTYSSLDLPVDDISENAFKEARSVRVGRLWIPTCKAIHAYDTFAPVDHVGWVDLSGTCGYCGGGRSRPKCTCSDYLHAIESRKPRTDGGPSEAGPQSGRGPGRDHVSISDAVTTVESCCDTLTVDHEHAAHTAQLPVVSA